MIIFGHFGISNSGEILRTRAKFGEFGRNLANHSATSILKILEVAKTIRAKLSASGEIFRVGQIFCLNGFGLKLKPVITNRNPLGSHAVRQAVTEKTAEAPGRRSTACPRGPLPREAAGPPPCGRVKPQRAAGSRLSPEPRRSTGCAIT